MTTSSPSAIGTSPPIETVIARIRAVYGRWDRTTPIAQRRRDWDELLGGSGESGLGEAVDANGVPCRWIEPEARRADGVVVYFHGGGYQLGSVASHAGLMQQIASASGCRVLGVEYRLAPEHRFPAASDDALTVFAWLLEQGVAAPTIAFAGDSAGGNLALAALLRLRDRGGPIPASAVLLSPWTDLAATGKSYETRAHADPLHQRPLILAMARAYLGPEVDCRNPLASPLHADLSGLPPLLIQVGDRETVLDDAVCLAAKAEQSGVSVELTVWDEMIHAFQLFPDVLPEARQAICEIGRFLAVTLAAPPDPSLLDIRT